MADQTSRRSYLGRSFKFQYLVSNFILEDKIVSEEGCIVSRGDRMKKMRERPLHVYYRRRKSTKGLNCN